LQIRFAGGPDDVAAAYPRLAAALDAAGVGGKCRYRVELVFDEIVTNIVHHGAPEGRTLQIFVAFEARGDVVELTFEDDGIPFDSSAPTPQPVLNSLDEVQIGGFGLILVRESASELRYTRTAEGRNRLVVVVPRDTV
jgi:anti-sigma regulatory factor (Ser/Thr protein kinase)